MENASPQQVVNPWPLSSTLVFYSFKKLMHFNSLSLGQDTRQACSGWLAYRNVYISSCLKSGLGKETALRYFSEFLFFCHILSWFLLGKGHSWGDRVHSEEVVSGRCEHSSLRKLRKRKSMDGPEFSDVLGGQ